LRTKNKSGNFAQICGKLLYIFYYVSKFFEKPTFYKIFYVDGQFFRDIIRVVRRKTKDIKQQKAV